MKLFFEKQGWHALALAVLLALLWLAAGRLDLSGSYLGLSAGRWYWLAAWVAVAHQVWVLLAWRAQLHYGWVSKTFGELGFRLYGAGFMLLGLARIGAMIGLALADRGSLAWPQPLLTALSLVCAAFVVWLMYSVLRYFGMERALGGDHFFEKYRQGGMVTQGIYRYIDNAMYTVGFLGAWLIAFAFASQAALVLAAFNHLYVWVHYFTTEKPDMARIYGAS